VLSTHHKQSAENLQVKDIFHHIYNCRCNQRELQAAYGSNKEDHLSKGTQISKTIPAMNGIRSLHSHRQMQSLERQNNKQQTELYTAAIQAA
jgi:hypothetical protein